MTLPYGSGVALWTAVRDRARAEARHSNIPADQLARRFVYERFLARIFADPTEPWVLKGGIAVLARVNDARHSKDVDLLRSLGDLDEAVAALQAAAAVNLGDYFRFEPGNVRRMPTADAQPRVQASRVQFAPYCGSVRAGNPFSVDVVIGSLMVGTPETRPAAPTLPIPGLSAPMLSLYPTVDHIADKLCATEATYGGIPSSRVRDLVDLVVFARTQTIDGTDLNEAITAERAYRDLPVRITFAPPPGWASTFGGVAKASAHTVGMKYGEAVALTSDLLVPAMAGTSRGRLWHPSAADWTLAGA